jgi:hypothetical protein
MNIVLEMPASAGIFFASLDFSSAKIYNIIEEMNIEF